jgi:DNA-binding CsgD family transcriptional regulator
MLLILLRTGTLAEAGVALCAASGASIPETTQKLNVSPNTAKTHLRCVRQVWNEPTS